MWNDGEEPICGIEDQSGGVRRRRSDHVLSKNKMLREILSVRKSTSSTSAVFKGEKLTNMIVFTN